MTDQPTTTQPPDHRASVVAGIRALADFIETRTDLPVPDGATAQYSELDRSKVEQVVRQVAAALGIEPHLHSTNNGISIDHTIAEHGFPDYFQVKYTVYGFLPTADDEAGEQA